MLFGEKRYICCVSKLGCQTRTPIQMGLVVKKHDIAACEQNKVQAQRLFIMLNSTEHRVYQAHKC